jgi:hypothetical protein
MRPRQSPKIFSRYAILKKKNKLFERLRSKVVIGLGVVGLGVIAPLQAQQIDVTRGSTGAALPALELAKPFGECRLGFWTGNRNLDDQEGVPLSSCLLSWKPKFSETLGAGLNVRALHQLKSPLEPSQSRTTSRLREAYVQGEWGDWSLKLGRQIIAWGRADRVSPSDVLSPRDLTVLSGEDEEQRNGLNALQTRYQVTQQVSLAAVIAQFEPNRLPQAQLPAGLIRGIEPNRTEWALKVDRSGTGWDGAISFYDGFDRNPRFWGGVSKLGSPVFQNAFERHQVLALDFASSAGRWTFRAEAAHIRATPTCVACPLDSRRVQRWILGVDRDFGDAANLNFQLFGVQRSGYTDPSALAAPLFALGQAVDRLNGEYGARETGVTLRLSDRFLNDRLRVELGAVMEFKNNSAVLRPRLSYAFNDRVSLRAGVDQFSGPAQSFFGARRKNNLAFVELVAQF